MHRAGVSVTDYPTINNVTVVLTYLSGQMFVEKNVEFILFYLFKTLCAYM